MKFIMILLLLTVSSYSMDYGLSREGEKDETYDEYYEYEDEEEEEDNEDDYGQLEYTYGGQSGTPESDESDEDDSFDNVSDEDKSLEEDYEKLHQILDIVKRSWALIKGWWL